MTYIHRSFSALSLAGALIMFGSGLAQAGQADAAEKATTKTADAGLPVESALVRDKCGSCHKVEPDNRMSRISYRRASPENWEMTIKRMVAVNNVVLEPADAREILKYLADHHGLAPEEAKPVRWEAERRMDDFSYEADKPTATVCASCHSLGRVLSERRTTDDWQLLIAMHRGYYPLVDNQPMANGMGFRRTRPAETEPGPDGRPPDNRHPVDKVLAHLTKAYPLMTPAWTSWAAAMTPARVAGKWLVSGYQPGAGPVFGEFIVTADQGADTFETRTSLTVPSTGKTMVRTGKSTVYTGYQWRGRATAAGEAGSWREVMMVERNGREMSGRWYTGAYDETGMDVTLVKAGSDPAVMGTSALSLKTGGSHSLTVFGANFPAAIDAKSIDLGSGVQVTRVGAVASDRIQMEVAVAADAKPGPRDVMIAGSVKPSAFIVYSKIDGITVLPKAGMARVGGAVFPKQLQQFEAVAYSNGPDGKPNTKDEWILGPVDAKFTVEEYAATFGDDDLQFAGTIDPKGMFTPALDGPNPERSGERNNIGDLWVVAEYTPPGTDKPLKARAYLLVSVPVYMRWVSTAGDK